MTTWRKIWGTASESESLAGLSDFGERLFWRLVAKADSWGRLQGSTAKIRAACIPMLTHKTDEEIDGALAELESAERLVRYWVEGKAYVQLTDWDEHQETRRRGPSRLPAPPKSTESTPASDFGESASNGRPKDELWEALVEAMGTPAPVTKSGRGAWNRALSELRAAGATPDLIAAAAASYRQHWPKIDLTPTALAKHWHVFLDAATGADVREAAFSWFETVGLELPERSFDDELTEWGVRGLDPSDADDIAARYAQETRRAA